MIRRLWPIVAFPLVVFALMASTWVPVLAQCWGGVQSGTVGSAPERYDWVEVSADEVALLRSGVQVGSWNAARGWRDFNPVTQVWGELRASAPVTPPLKYAKKAEEQCRCGKTCPFGNCPDGCTCAAKACGCQHGAECGPETCNDQCKCLKCQTARSVPNYGLDIDRIGADGNSLHGKPCTRKELIAALVADVGVPSDAGRLRVTVIGADAAERGRVMTDLETHPLLTPFLEQTCRQEYAPTEWPVQNGHKSDGLTIYLQKPDGAVLSRTVGYPGPELLAQALTTAIRRNDPSYDAAKDPDLAVKKPAKPDDKPADPDVKPAPMPALPLCCLAAVLALLILARRSQP